MSNLPNFALPGLMDISRPLLDAQLTPLVITRGVSFSEVWSVPIADGAPDLTGYTATADVLHHPGGDVLFSITVTVNDPAAAELTLTLTAVQTEALAVGAGVTSLLLIAPGGEVEVLVKNNPVIVQN